MAQKMRTAKKLAIFFASIPKEKAVDILKYFSVSSMEQLASELRSLGKIPKEVQVEVLKEVASKLAEGVDAVGGEEMAKELLKEVIGEEKAREILEKAQPKRPRPFSGLINVSAQDLATILSNEHPTTVAMILGFFPPKKTSEILEFFNDDFREEVVVRLAKDRTTDFDIIERIENIFVQKVTTAVSPQEEEEDTRALGGPEYLAEVFQNIDKETEDKLLAAIQEESEDIAVKIRELMFTFDDIVKLSDSDVQKILREIPMEKLVIALRGASPEVSEKFMKNLSKRAKENLQEEMELLGKVKRSEVEEQRKVIVGIIRALEASGEITVGGGEQDEYI